MTKQFKIGAPVLDKHEAHRYYVEVSVMFGDADSYRTLEIGPFEEAEDTRELLDVLDRMKAAYPNGRMGGGRDNYDNVDGFVEWFVGVEREEAPWGWETEPLWWKFRTVDNYDETWPVDQYDYETHGGMNGYKVAYYDFFLHKHEVDITDD